MAAPKRTSDASLTLEERLLAPGIPRTNLFTAIRILQSLSAGDAPIGRGGPFSREGIRFRHTVSLASQPNELRSIARVEIPRSVEQALDKRRYVYEVETCVLGLTGADSPLPMYFAHDLVTDDDWSRPQAAFLDLFHNRLTALFFRAVGKYDYVREFSRDGSDAGSARVLSLVGHDVRSQQDPAVRPPALLHLARLFAYGSSARGLQAALRSLLGPSLEGAEVVLHQFTGGWVRYQGEQTNRLGQANNQVGASFMIGTRVRHPAHRAKITIGPMPPSQAERFEPGGTDHHRIAALVNAFCPDPLVFDLELLIEEGQYPPFVLGRRTLGRDVCLVARRRSERMVSRVHPLDRG